MSTQVRTLDELLSARRSIRQYTAQAVPQEMMMAMIQAAAWAPSPSNSQPVRFVRMASQPIRSALHTAMIKGRDYLLATHCRINAPIRLKNRINTYWRYAEFIFNAPVLLAVGVIDDHMGFSDHLAQAGLIKTNTRTEIDLDISIGLALKGLLLKAEELGLGTCILTAPLAFIADTDRILGLAHFKIKCFLTIGYAAECPTAPWRLSSEDIYQEI